MSFVIVSLIMLGILALIAAIASYFDKGSDQISTGHDCSTCSAADEGSCKIHSLMEEKKRCKAHSEAHLLLVFIAMSCALAGCSAQKNTAKSRWWHSFNARYNTYFNGQQAFIDGNLEKEKANHDNFTEQIPLYPVANKASRETGRGHYERAIEKAEKAIKQHSIKAKPEWKSGKTKTAKDREWLARREYNPFIWRAWMLLGKAQFQKGAFDEAAATFAYMSRQYQTQPMQNGLARAWLAKCYTELDWLYDAEDVIRNMNRDSTDFRAVKDWDYTYANYYLHTGELEKAAPYLRRVIRHERRNTQRAREWFLMGQIQQAMGHQSEAERAYGKVIGCHPPYELEFNARIAQTEVMATTNAHAKISRLRRMAASDNNKDYLDQVYYAIGNIYMAQRDTLRAIAAYETGSEKATRSGIEKGVLLLTLGNLYWQLEKYADAQRCYGQAIGLLDKDREGYAELSERSKMLDELVPHTEAIHLQDSLLALASMPEAERLAVIDRMIRDLKKKEREEQRAQQAAEAEQQQQRNAATGNRTATQRTPTAPQTQQSGGQWYFYNPMTVNQGKTTFQQQWGKRENTDNWQRINQTVVNLAADTNADTAEDEETAPADSLTAAPPTDNIATEQSDSPADTLANDPHNREYYLAQIPFTEEQQAAAHATIAENLLPAGIIMKDKLDNLPLSKRLLLRLINDYPESEQLDLAWYHLYLIYAREGQQTEADNCLGHLKAEHAESEWTQLLSDPYFAENARFGSHIEDSLYAATYEAFKNDRHDIVSANVRLSEERFPLGDHRDKFIFISGLSQLNNGDGTACVSTLTQLIEHYPTSDVAEIAGMIVKGAKEGRRLHGGKFDIGDVWSRRDITMAADSTVTDSLSPDPNQDFLFVLVYHPDSVDHNQLLYQMARYNFTNFLVRNFDIQTDEDQGLYRMMFSGFTSFDEALQYGRQLYADKAMAERLMGCRSLIVSATNLPLLGRQFSYDDYDTFYQEHFQQLKVSQEHLLNQPDQVEIIDPEDLSTDKPAAEQPDSDSTDDFMQPRAKKTKKVEDFDFGDDFW